MHIIRSLIIFALFFIHNSILNAQNKKLEDLSFIELENKIDSSYNKKKELWIYINQYIKKSKKEKNPETLLYAFRYASAYTYYPTNIKYSDSIISVANKSKNNKLITEALINRNNILMDNFMHKEALDYIINANKYAKILNDDYLINKTKYFIAQNKIYLGLYEEANVELESCIQYFRSNLKNYELGKDYEIYYIYSLITLIDSNTKINKQNENKLLFKEAYQYIKENNLKEYYPYFVSSEGIDDFYSKKYVEAIKTLKKAISLYNDQWPHFTEIFYIGLSYWKLGNKTEAIKYFEKLDKDYYKDKNQSPHFRQAYELLIDYYSSKNNKDKQLEYINKLMILDKSYEKNYKYLFAKINKEYDNQKLIDEKNKIENNLKLHQYLTLGIIIFCVLFISISTYKYFEMKKRYKTRFKEIISENSNPKINKTTTLSKKNTEIKNISFEKIPGLNDTIVENILNQIDIFEKEKHFLDAKINLKLLSEKFGTNATYLSKTINVYKGKNFNNYLNDLRLDYIILLIKSDNKYLSKEIKELSHIAGFANSEAFSDHFQKKYKIKPSYFIKLMTENIRTSSQ